MDLINLKCGIQTQIHYISTKNLIKFYKRTNVLVLIFSKEKMIMMINLLVMVYFLRLKLNMLNMNKLKNKKSIDLNKNK